MNIFEKASRKALRFETNKGLIPTETLWDMPLKSKFNFDLDTVAKNVSRQLKVMDEESFVETNVNAAKAVLELQLEIIKFIIADKQAEAVDKAARAERKAEREKLLEILSKKQDASLEALEVDQIKARLAELG